MEEDACPRLIRIWASSLNKWFAGKGRKFVPPDPMFWEGGPCWMIAEALHRWLGPVSSLWAVYAEGVVDHVLVRIGSCLIDDQGAWAEEDLLVAAREAGVLDPTLMPFDPLKAGGIECPIEAVTKLVGGLNYRYGDGKKMIGRLEWLEFGTQRQAGRS